MGAILSILFKAATVVGTALFAADTIHNFFSNDTPERRTAETHVSSAVAAGASPDEMLKISAGTKYDQLEQAGKSPDDFWKGLSPEQQEAIKFSPASLRSSMDRTSFLGLTSAFLFVAAFGAGLFGAARGLPLIYRTLAKVAAARSSGAGATELMTLLEEGKIEGIAKVWIPGLVATIAGAGAWLTSSMTNNMNDVDLWGRINLQQAEADWKKAQARLAGSAGDDKLANTFATPKTRITMSKNSKPVLYTGVLFSSRVGSLGVFDRVLDDKITDKEDLKNDAQQNMNKWLATMASRLIYQIRLANNPYDETGVQLTGYWATLSIAYQKISGQLTYLDTIPLGPVDPVVYMPKPQETEQIQIELPKLLTSKEISAIELPSGDFNIIDKTGTPVPITFSEATKLPAYTTPFVQTQYSGPVPTGYDEAYYRQTGTLRLLGAAGGNTGASPVPVPTGTPASAAVTAPAPMPAPAPAPIAPYTPAANSVNPLPIFMPPAPTPAPTPAPAAPVIPTLPNGLKVPSQYQLRTPEGYLNIRSAPGLSGTILGRLPDRWYGDVIGYGGFVDGLYWVKISQAGFPVGYAAATYLFYTGA